MRHLLVLALLAMSCDGSAAGVPARSPATTAATTASTPVRLDAAFEPGPFTRPLPPPMEGEWLAEHPETGQTYEQFEASGRLLPTPERRVIYLQPIGTFSGSRTVDLEQLRAFTQTFFQLPVVVNAPIALDRFETREGFEFGPQVKTHDVLAALEPILPSDAYCVLGVTMADLYPSPKWNFVFGMASLKSRVGVFSFARYSPPGDAELTEQERRKMTQRAFKVLAHETGHMFGIKHCTAFRCGMNGSNSLPETDRAPLAFCPVCLRKLQSSIGFDVVARDAKLAQNLTEADLLDDAAWFEHRRDWLLEPHN